LYWTAPFVGGITAALLYKKFFSEKAPEVQENKPPLKSQLRTGSGRRGFLDYTIDIEGPKERSVEGVCPNPAQEGLIEAQSTSVLDRSYPITEAGSVVTFTSRADDGDEEVDTVRYRDVSRRLSIDELSKV
ncbi:Aquaporin-4, partial [Biomphalaria glabrata]